MTEHHDNNMSGIMSAEEISERDAVLALDPTTRLMHYHTQLETGVWTVDEFPDWAKDDLNAIAEQIRVAVEAFLEALKPFVQQMAIALSDALRTYVDRVDELNHLAAQMPDPEADGVVEGTSVDIVNMKGEVVETFIAGGVDPATLPVPATTHVANNLAPLLEPTHDQLYAAQEAVKEPFLEPFKIQIDNVTNNSPVSGAAMGAAIREAEDRRTRAEEGW